MEQYDNSIEKEILNGYLKIVEERCEEFREVKQKFLVFSKELESCYPHTQKILELHENLLIFSLVFTYSLGFIDNSNHFFNPHAPTFMEKDFDKILYESEMHKSEDYIKTNRELDEYTIEMSKSIYAIYSKMLEYYSYLDTYIPKLAHYYGFTKANTEFSKRIKNYKPDEKLTEEYKNWLSDYLKMDLD